MELRITEVIRLMHSVLRRMEICVLALCILFTGSAAWDMFTFTRAGSGSGEYHGLEELRASNPDAAGWIRLDGTHISYPVMHGSDNFEYLSKDPKGEYYQGGSIFLDAANSADFSDQYIIIHGHHMARGAMFGDITEYMDESFFRKNTTGELITPGGVYELAAAGVKTADAYDSELYYAGPEAGRPLHLMDDCVHMRKLDFEDGDKLVLLSTCSGDMTNSRTVLFCRARYTGESDVRYRKKQP